MQVTTEIKKILNMKDAKTLSGAQAVKELLEELQKQLFMEIHRGGDWDKYHLKKLLKSVEYQISNFEAKAKAEASGQVESMWGMGQNLVDLPLRKAGIYYGFANIPTSVLDTLKDFAFGKISGLAGDAFDKVKGELTLGMLGGKTPAEVASAIFGQIKDLPIPTGKYGNPIFKSIAERAEVITRTEMSRAFETASDMRRKQAGQYLPKLMKVWIHAGNPRKPRVSHLVAHGQKVPYDKPFIVGGLKLDHPKDSNAPIKEIMN